MKKFLLFLFVIVSAGAIAQSGRIKGSVQTSDQQPAAYVNVALKGTSKGSTTDGNGNYEIKNVEAGAKVISISFVGHEPKEITVDVIAGQTTVVPLITLDESSQNLDEIVVSGTRSYKEDVVSSSLRLNTPVLEVPQNIQIITGKTLTDQQVISMSDGVIRNVSGAVRMEHWGDMYTNISMRGSQIQAFRNGFNLVNSYWGPLTEDMSFVDHIEFVKGPAGFMLANGDPSGLYNVVTKKPTGQNRREVSLTAGSFGLYRGSLDADGKLTKNGKLLYRINVAAQQKNSFRKNEFNDRYSVAPVLSYQITDKTKVTLEYTYQRAKMSNVGSYYIYYPEAEGFGKLPADFTTLPKGLEPTTMNDNTAFVNIQHEFSKDWKVTAQATYNNYKQIGSSMWPTVVNADGTMIRNVSIWDAKSSMTLAQAFVNGNAKTGSVSHRILGGFDFGNKEYFADWGQYFDIDTEDNPFDPKNPNYTIPANLYPQFDRVTSLEERAKNAGGLMDQRYAAGYIQDELGFMENKLRLTLAGRYTYVTQGAWGGTPDKDYHFTPRVGVSASLDKQTSAYALYDQAFTPQSGILNTGGAAKPLTGNNIELGIKRDWIDGKWSSTVAIYRILKNNEAIADPNSPPASQVRVEIGQKRAQGLEIDIRGTIVDGLNLIANYAYTDVKVTKDTYDGDAIEKGDIVPGYAKHTSNAWLSYKLQSGVLKGTGISLGYTWLMDRLTYWDASPDPNQQLPDYAKLDGGLFWENDKIRVTANVFNITNKYIFSGSYYAWQSFYYTQVEAPRNYRMSISYKF